MAVSWPLSGGIEAPPVGNVANGINGPFFGSARLKMLVIEKLVYGDPADVLSVIPFDPLSPLVVVVVVLAVVDGGDDDDRIEWPAGGLLPAALWPAGDLGGLNRESALWLKALGCRCWWWRWLLLLRW